MKCVFCLLFLLFLSTLIGLAAGSVYIPLTEQALIFLHNLGLSDAPIDSTTSFILIHIRLPRILLALFGGFALSFSGAVMQGIFRNPLADPYVLGIASGATAGAALVISLGIATIPLSLSAGSFLGGIMAVVLVYMVSQTKWGQISPYLLILSGVAIASLFSSLTSFLILISKDSQLRQVVFWVMGSFSMASWPSVLTLAVSTVIVSSITMIFANDLNGLALGEDMACHLGINTILLQKSLLALSTFLTASVVSVSGTIGFVGLIVPHTVRLWVGPNHRILLPASGLAGASFMVLCDTLSRTLVSPGELPVGMITSLLGAPFFLYLLKIAGKKGDIG